MSQGEVRRGSQAIERALAVLDCFSSAPELSLSDVASRTGLAVSTTYRIIQALVRGGYLERDPGEGYRIGRRLADLVPRAVIADEVSPYLYALAAGIKITVSFGVMDACQLATLVSARPPVRYCAAQIPAEREPLHATAMGKALLAFDSGGPGSVARRLGPRLHAYTARTLRSADALIAELEEVRRRGFALSDGERTEGVRAVAVPVFTGSVPERHNGSVPERHNGSVPERHNGSVPERQLAGAIGVQARSQRMTDDLVRSLVPALHHFAGEVGGRLQDEQLLHA